MKSRGAGKVKPTWAQHGSKMGPESAQNGSLEAPVRPLGGPWAALGGSLGAKADFRAILGCPRGSQQGLDMKKNVPESHLKFDAKSE